VLLNVAAQGGIVSLAAFLAMALFVLRKSLRSGPALEQTAVVKTGLGIALAVALFYHGLTGSFEDARHLWVLMGLVVAADESIARDDPR
jgi:hypothetical protein